MCVDTWGSGDCLRNTVHADDVPPVPGLGTRGPRVHQPLHGLHRVPPMNDHADPQRRLASWTSVLGGRVRGRLASSGLGPPSKPNAEAWASQHPIGRTNGVPEPWVLGAVWRASLLTDSPLPQWQQWPIQDRSIHSEGRLLQRGQTGLQQRASRFSCKRFSWVCRFDTSTALLQRHDANRLWTCRMLCGGFIRCLGGVPWRLSHHKRPT